MPQLLKAARFAIQDSARKLVDVTETQMQPEAVYS